MRKIIEFGVSSLYPYFEVAMSIKEVGTGFGKYKEICKIDVPNMHDGVDPRASAISAWLRMRVDGGRRNVLFQSSFSGKAF